MKQSFFKKIKAMFYCDLRSLALARIVMGIAILLDLGERLLDYQLFLTDSGLIPIDRARVWIEKLNFISLYTWIDHPIWTPLLLLLTVMCALCLIVGFKTRVSTVASWILMISLQNRTFVLDYPGDWIMRLLLFWGIFLPWGERFSVDSKTKRAQGNDWVFSPAFSLVLIQMVFFFWVSGLSKVGVEWSDGSAVSHALRLKSYAKSAALWLSQFHTLNWGLNYLTLFAELAVPFLLVSPWKNRTLRLIGCVLLTVMVFTFGAFINFDWLGVTLFVGIATILPPEFWKKIAPQSQTVTGSEPKSKWSRGLALLIFLAVGNLVYLNLLSLKVFGYSVPIQKVEWLDKINARLRLDQFFVFFPTPRDSTTAWGIFVGVREDGRLINLFNESEKVWEEPDTMVNVAPNFRQLRGMNNAMWNAYEKTHPTYLIQDVAQYYCSHWRARGAPLKKMQWWMVLLYREKGKVTKSERVQLGEEQCSADQSSKTKS